VPSCFLAAEIVARLFGNFESGSGGTSAPSSYCNGDTREIEMTHKGSCHCGRIAFEVEGDLAQVMECNCSHCSRKGYLLWFVPRERFRLSTPESALATYLFNKHVIKHHFCPACGCAPFGFGTDPAGKAMAAINVRCLEGVEPATLKIKPFDGRSR